MTDRLRDPRARRFSNALFRACGCRLVFHKGRRTYIAFRPRGGRFTTPQTYLDVGTAEQLPGLSLIPALTDAIRWADARMGADLVVMLEVAERRMEEASNKRRDTFINGWLPEYMKDLNRWKEILGDGRIATKFFDTKPKVSAPTGAII